jgi:hypothetical protein
MNIQTSASLILPDLSYAFEEVISKEFGKVFILPDQKIMICELYKAYVPIEEFKEIFSATVPLIEKHQTKKFIFDKQQLRVFHQPSMEWYFLDWKKEIYGKGLSIHRKILPQDQPAFKLAVEAGLAKIHRENKDTIIPLLDIRYSTSVVEAIEK